MKKKLHKLQVQEAPYEVIAIVCPENHLKFSWLLNSNFGYSFKENESISVEHNPDSQNTYPTHRDEKQLLTLVKNRIEGIVLIKSLPNIDFLLKIDGIRSATEIKKIIKNIKTVPGVLGVMHLDKRKIDLTLLEGV